MSNEIHRREMLRGATSLATAALVAGSAANLISLPAYGQSKSTEPEVSATEDLMREHGVIRRALLVYFETIPRLRENPSGVDPSALRQTAQLFRTFGEDYHERMLEEQHIFPLVRKKGGELERYADILIQQHNRGREITDYVLAVTSGPKIGAQHAQPLAKVFESFVLMYENHAAREDTIIFPA